MYVTNYQRFCELSVADYHHVMLIDLGCIYMIAMIVDFLLSMEELQFSLRRRKSVLPATKILANFHGKRGNILEKKEGGEEMVIVLRKLFAQEENDWDLYEFDLRKI